MNKFKFFGSTLMAAVFALGLASCEKEDFKTEVKPEVNAPTINIPGVDIPSDLPNYVVGDAVISIQPSVWAVIDGKVQDVTAVATISFNGEEKATYTASSKDGFAAMTVEIAATYVAGEGEEAKTYTGETTVEVPALSAGQVAIFTPTLVLSAQPSEDEGGEGEGGEGEGTTPGGSTGYGPYVVLTSTNTTSQKYHCDVQNQLDYYYPEVTVTTDKEFMLGAKVTATNLINTSYQTEFNNTVNSYNNYTEEKITFGTYPVYAKSVTCVEFTITSTVQQYTFVEGTTRAAGDAIGTFEVTDNSYIINGYNTDIALPGSGHGHGNGNGHGHGNGNAHDHGHGSDNAGGGIVSPM